MVTAMGADQEGLLPRVASSFAVGGGRLAESRLVRLGGQFAGAFRAVVPDGSDASDVVAALKKLGLSVSASGPLGAAPPGGPAPPVVRKITMRPRRAAAAPGSAASLVEPAARALCAHGLVVQSLDLSPDGGMVGSVAVPEGCAASTAAVVDALNAVGVHVNNLDLEFGP